MTMTTRTDPGTGQETDPVDQEPELLVGRGCTTLTPDTTKIMTQEILPGRMTKMTKGTMTLAMGDTIEGAARRPCFMGGPL